MKNLLILCLFGLLSLFSSAQSLDSSQVGKVVYYEGKVDLGVGTAWRQVKINSAVKKNQHIRTVGDGIAEITWNNGTKSFVGPNSVISVRSLMTGSTGNSKSQTESSFNNFKSIFNASNDKKRSQEGGIRRTETKVRKKPAKDEVYWKEDKEVFFEDGYSLYEKGNYRAAITRLEAFLNQKPKDPMVKYAYFALAHSYIMENNTVKAREILERFLVEFPEDQLSSEASRVVSALE